MQQKNIHASFFTSNKVLKQDIKDRMLQDAEGSNLKITFTGPKRFKVTRISK